MLYIGTGDARDPDTAQDQSSLAGKLLRVTPEGAIPDDNPLPHSPVFLTGIRNTQGFDWPDASTIWLTDHGPLASWDARVTIRTPLRDHQQLRRPGYLSAGSGQDPPDHGMSVFG